jgi:hypothetical protein
MIPPRVVAPLTAPPQNIHQFVSQERTLQSMEHDSEDMGDIQMSEEETGDKLANFWGKTIKRMRREIDEVDQDDFEDP